MTKKTNKISYKEFKKTINGKQYTVKKITQPRSTGIQLKLDI